MAVNYVRDSAQGLIKNLILGGIGLAIIGGAIAFLAWPGTEVASSALGDVDTEETGNAVIAAMGAAAAWAGNLLLLVGLVGWGVRLGNEATLRKS
ncbi:hypothetical protein [Nocardioides soli]|uniref:Uncharacterized protein n=1 Tax=Nocardioides soli TaxID=1036020 RepID=A0A7W4Z2W9_9ACTN|nr:hypothetical protein [Nocardioides soli]MBB3044899.1 hypothetical protein [Nocardioides soli]